MARSRILELNPAYPIPSKEGKWVLFKSARNIAERKALEMALQQSLEHQRRLTGFNVLLSEVNQA
jgi:hypothetical protein